MELAEGREVGRRLSSLLSACVKEVLQCSGEASLLFEGETRTSDNGFMILGILPWLGLNG